MLSKQPCCHGEVPLEGRRGQHLPRPGAARVREGEPRCRNNIYRFERRNLVVGQDAPDATIESTGPGGCDASLFLKKQLTSMFGKGRNNDPVAVVTCHAAPSTFAGLETGDVVGLSRQRGRMTLAELGFHRFGS